MLRDARARTAQPPWRAGPKPSSPRGPGRTAGTTPATSDPLDMTTERADLYATLGVRPSATQAEISHAYRALLRRYHPDTRPDDESQNATSDAALQHVLAAYTVLSDPARRADYDRERTPPSGPAPRESQQVLNEHSAYRQPPIVVGPVRWHRGPYPR